MTPQNNSNETPPNDVNATERAGKRAELDHIWNNLRAGVQILWEAFKTYFTVMGLLLAGIAFLQGEKSGFQLASRNFFSLMISVGGVFITLLARPGIRRIITYQRQFLEYGAQLESDLGGRLTTSALGTWRKAGDNGSDELTYRVFNVFVIGWGIATLYFCIALAPGVADYVGNCAHKVSR